MFLDPEPRRPKQTMSRSPFLPATESPGDQRWRIRRKPLPEQTALSTDEQPPANSNHSSDHHLEELRRTVRLVTHSQSPPDTASTQQRGEQRSVSSTSDPQPGDDFETPTKTELQRHERAQPQLPSLREASAAEVGLQGSSASSQDKHVSDPPTSANEVLKLGSSATATLPGDPSSRSKPQTQWYRSGSSGNFSSTSTLQEGDSSTSVPDRRSGRLSQLSTLRGTPTPTEWEIRNRVGSEGSDEVQYPAHVLDTLQETSPERPTVRPVPPSVKSSTGDHSPSESSLPRPQTAPSSDSDETDAVPRKQYQRRFSTSSIPAPVSSRKTTSYSAPRHQGSQDSFAQSEVSFIPEPSSPIFVIYESDNDTRSRSASQPLRYTPSVESIQSRLQYPTAIPQRAAHDLSNSSSWASLQPSSSTETLPPLNIPKKRLRHKPKSDSLGSAVDTVDIDMELPPEEEIDTLPYPRNRFSTPLSTIVSESDSRSRNTSQHLSHFSLGSGVLTGDDASSIPRPRRRGSAPIESTIESTISESSEAMRQSSNGEGAGDMTLGIYREESAKPPPLFKPRGYDPALDGPLPPIPPIPKSRDSDENFDTVSELQAPSLKAKRSGYSLRNRSNSTPSRSNGHSRGQSAVSYVDSERGSHGSSIFPQWAKHFYGGNGQLLSSSKISFDSWRPKPSHLRNDSQWTERSITSRLGTGYSEIDTGSPTSSHFLPSIFRPRTRGKKEEGKRSRPSGEAESRPDSLAIFNAPLPQSRNGDEEVLPSGQPKYGKLNDIPAGNHPPLPRKYSKQKQWDQMQFPRPMTKDRMSELELEYPHLAPNKRASARVSTWRPPSFSEGLDSLIKSRCNRQILLFALGFICPPLWMLAAVLPIPSRPPTAEDLEKTLAASEEDVQAAMMKHEAGDAEKRWREEKQWLKARWWRALNRVMSVIGVLIIAAIVSVLYDADQRTLTDEALADRLGRGRSDVSGIYYTLPTNRGGFS